MGYDRLDAPIHHVRLYRLPAVRPIWTCGLFLRLAHTPMKAYLTTNRDRLSKRYKAIHRQLAAEVKADREPEPDKLSRRKQRSAEYRQTGEIPDGQGTPQKIR